MSTFVSVQKFYEDNHTSQAGDQVMFDGLKIPSSVLLGCSEMYYKYAIIGEVFITLYCMSLYSDKCQSIQISKHEFEILKGIFN